MNAISPSTSANTPFIWLAPVMTLSTKVAPAQCRPCHMTATAIAPGTVDLQVACRALASRNSNVNTRMRTTMLPALMSQPTSRPTSVPSASELLATVCLLYTSDAADDLTRVDL